MGGIIGIAKQTGNAAYSATVQSSYTDVTISCGTYTDIGGIVGRTNSSLVNKCYSMANISASGAGCTGGIVGRSAGSTISGCWTSGDIQGTSSTQGYAGGIIGVATAVNEIITPIGK